MPDETSITSPDEGAQLTTELIDWLFARTSNSRLLLLVLAKALAILLIRVKPAGITYAQQRRKFVTAMTAELKCAEKFSKSQPR
jgi:hypothetical protein